MGKQSSAISRHLSPPRHPARRPASARSPALNLDRLIHERLPRHRQRAAVNECLSFTDLKRLLDTTDGSERSRASWKRPSKSRATSRSMAAFPARYRLTAAGRALESISSTWALIKAGEFQRNAQCRMQCHILHFYIWLGCRLFQRAIRCLRFHLVSASSINLSLSSFERFRWMSFDDHHGEIAASCRIC